MSGFTENKSINWSIIPFWALILLLEFLIGFLLVIKLKLPLGLVLLIFSITLFIIKPEYGLLLFIFFLPFTALDIFSSPADWFEVQHGKSTVDLPHAFFALSLFAWVINNIAGGKRKIFRKNYFSTPLILLLVWVVISACWAPDLKSALLDIVSVTYCFTVFYFIITVINTRRLLYLAGWCWVLSAIIECTLTLIFRPQYGEQTISTFGADEVVGFLFGSANYFSQYLFLSFFILLALYWLYDNKLYRQATTCALILIVTTIITTKSKVGIVSFSIGLLFFFFLQNRKKLFWLIFIIVLIFSLMMVGGVGQKILSQLIVKESWIGSLLGRFMVWEISLQIILDTYFLGTGIGGFKPVAEQYSNIIVDWKLHGPHNFLLAIFTELGVIGFSLATIFFAKIVKVFIIPLKEQIAPELRFFCYSLVAGLFSLFLSSFVINMFLTNSIMWVYMGLAVASINIILKPALLTRNSL